MSLPRTMKTGLFKQDSFAAQLASMSSSKSESRASTSTGPESAVVSSLTATGSRRRVFDSSFHGWFSDHEKNGEEEEEEEEGEAGEEYDWDGDFDTPSTSVESIITDPSTVPPKRDILSSLPVEVIEYIALSLQQPTHHGLDAAEHFVAQKCSDFATSRFALSALSRVSSGLRLIVERVLYRNIHVDITGWKGRKHPRWPAASLRLLLRTLTQRPDLARFICTASVDWQNHNGSEQAEEGLAAFLEFTNPNLTHFYMSCCPASLWRLDALTKVTTFATSHDHDIIAPILRQFPNLRTLLLRATVHEMDLYHVPERPHAIETLRLVSTPRNAAIHFAQALNMCAASVRVLEIGYLGGLLTPSPSFPAYMNSMPRTRMAGENVHTLRLDGISVLAHTASAPAALLYGMSSLRCLVLRHHDAFAVGAFSVLPATLRTMTIQDCYGRWTNRGTDEEEFMPALGAALRSAHPGCVPVAEVVVATGGGLGETAALMEACNDRDVPFKEEDMDIPSIRIRFK